MSRTKRNTDRGGGKEWDKAGEREREGREKRNSWLVRVEQRVADLLRRYTSKYVRAGRV